MSSSKRWLDANSDADEAEREILRAGLGADPPPQLQDDILRRVLAAAPLPALPDPSAPVAAAGSTAKAASTLALLGKGFVAGVGVSVAVAAGQHWVLRDPPRPAATVASHRSTPPVAAPAVPAPPAVASAVPIEFPEAEAEAQAKPSVPRTPSRHADAPREAPPPARPEPAAAVAPRESQLEQEAALLRTARQQLRQGSLAAAFATLETSRQRFSASELAQEREALMIELLYRSGQRSAAAARARAFLERHPESPHRGQVQKFAE